MADKGFKIPFFLIWIFVLPLSYATSFYPQPFPNLVQQALQIARGKVGMSYSDWGEDPAGTRRLYTYYELQVSEILKGSATGASLIMRELGGEKDGMGMHVPGASQYDRGEDVVVFLSERNKDGSYDVRGMSMGKYSIQTDPGGVETLVGMGIARTNLENPSDALSTQKWTLDSLRLLIQEQAHTQENKKLSTLPSPSLPPPPEATPRVPGLQTPLPQAATPASPVNAPIGIIAMMVGIGFLLLVFHRKK